MRRRRIQKPMFEIADFVFAKVHGYRAWPARILERFGPATRIQYRVFFYGTCNTSKVSSSQIYEFGKYQQRLGALRSGNHARNAGFRSAMAHVRQAFAKPADDFAYYQVQAQTNGDGGNAVAYEVVLPPTESEQQTDSDEEDSPENCALVAKDYSMKSLGSSHTDSQEKLEEPQPAKKSMPLLDDLAASDPDEVITTPEKKQPEEYDQRSVRDLFSDTDSDDFELPGNPIVRSAPLRHFDTTGLMLRNIPRSLRLDDDTDSEFEGYAYGDYENDQPINLSCRHVTADEQ